MGLDYAIVASLIVGAVGYLFWIMLMAARQKHMARLMKLTVWAVVIIMVATPLAATIQQATAWINGAVEKVENVTEKAESVTESIDNATKAAESVKKDPKGALWRWLQNQLRDPSKER